MRAPLTRTFVLSGLFALACASLPAAAQEEKPVEYIATALSDTVTLLEGKGGNIAISHGDDGVFIIDDQLKPLTEQLLVAIRKISDQPIRFVINTHYHADHVGANEELGESGSVIIAHDNVRKRMSTDQFSNFMNETTPAWPLAALPIVTFNDHVTLHMNGEDVTAYHVARGHTDGDSIVYFPGSNVLHMGDIFFNGLYPYIDLDGGGTVQGMIAGAEAGMALADEHTRIIPGHGPLSDLKGLTEYRDFLVKARDNVQQLIDQGMSLEQAIEAKPTAEWDEILGKIWITPEQLVTFIYNSLTGVGHYPAPESAEQTTE